MASSVAARAAKFAAAFLAVAVSLSAMAQPTSKLPPSTPASPPPQLQQTRAIVDRADSVSAPYAPDNSSALVIDLSEPPPPRSGAHADSPRSSGNGAFGDDRFAERVNGADTETVVATRLRDKTFVVPEGTVIPATLETGIDTDLPGFVRAVVSRDVCGFDGSKVLIPRGSRLIGEYRSGVTAGASRAFVVWSRLLTPNGMSIDIGSPATDQLGRGGLGGETNTHFFQRFGSAILLSVLTTGTAAVAARNTNAGAAVVVNSLQQANSIASIALQKDIDIPTTIFVPQGEVIHVFVARDVDFSAAAANRRP